MKLLNEDTLTATFIGGTASKWWLWAFAFWAADFLLWLGAFLEYKIPATRFFLMYVLFIANVAMIAPFAWKWLGGTENKPKGETK